MAFPGLPELAPEEKTPEVQGLQKGSLELVLQEKGELFLLSSCRPQKNKCKLPLLLPALANSSAQTRRDLERGQASTGSTAAAACSITSVPIAYHVRSQALPAARRCRGSFTQRTAALAPQRRRAALPGSATTSASRAGSPAEGGTHASCRL